MVQRWNRYLDLLPPGRLLLGMSAVFGVVHLLYFAAGIRFDPVPLTWAWQYLDPELLRTRLLESLWYLHSQPPMFNLFLGIVLKLFPGHAAIAFHGVYLALGLTLYLTVFLIMRGLGVSNLIAVTLSTGLMISPSFVLYEHWLYYTFPIATILAGSTLLLHTFLRTGKNRYAWTMFTLLALLCSMRSLFHIAYYALIGIGLLVTFPRNRRRLLLAIVVPGVFVLGLYCKNALLFGEFGSSSWLGMSLWKISGRQLPEAQLKQLVAEGKISPVALIEVYSAPEAYPASYRTTTTYPHIPALQQLRKSTGAKNLNHVSIVAVADQYRRDALYVLRHAPQGFMVGVAGAAFGYFKASSDLEFLDKNKRQISALNDLYNTALYGKIPFNIMATGAVPIYSDQPQFFYLFLLVGLPLLLLNGLLLAHGRRTGLDACQRLVVEYICFNIVYVAAISTLLEIGENNRIRFSTDPLYIVLLGLLLQSSGAISGRASEVER